MAISDDGTIPICDRCFVKLSVPCGWCGLPIVLGDPVTLMTTKADHTPPEGHATHAGYIVGCLRTTCCENEFDRVGYWMPKDDLKQAAVYFVPNPIAILKALMKGGHVTVVDCRHKPHVPQTDAEKLLGEIPSPNDYEE